MPRACFAAVERIPQRRTWIVIRTRLVVAALDGLRLNVLIAGDGDTAWLRPAVQQQLRALLG